MTAAALAIFTILIYSHNACSQNNKWTIKAVEGIKESVPDSLKFRYPKFVTGYVYFRDGKDSRALLNYNLLNGEMEFIAPDKDTLSIVNGPTIKVIRVNNDSFYYDKVYMELVMSYASIKLAKKELLKIEHVKKIGASDQSPSTSSINSLSSFYPELGDLILIKQTIYYIGDKYNHFLRANKKNVIKMFGRKQGEVEIFLSENKIIFNKEDDLKKLINFLQKI
jgi:hypothetical protein